MGIFDLLLIAIGLSMDAFAVSVTNGITFFKLKIKHALVIALSYGIFQGLMPVLGYFLGYGFEQYINSVAHWIALVLLSAIGGKMIYEGLKHGDECERRTGVFSFKLIMVQAVATSIDALMVGVTFAAMRAPLLISVSIIAVITFLISLAGVYIGKKFGCMLKSKSEVIGGAILVAIGVKIFIEHLILIPN